MSGRQGWLLGVTVVAAALLVLAVMGWPDARRQGEDGAARTDAGADDAAPFHEPRLEALREKVSKLDAGEVPRTENGLEVVAKFGWGSGPNQLGRSRVPEGNPEGPMSLSVDPSGNVWVLDQVNGRLVRLDKSGKQVGETRLPVQAPQDLAFAKDGTTLVLDRLVDGTVALLGADGKQLGELKVEGKGIEEGGAITGVFADGKDVYVEREHGDLVKLGDTSGKADPERPELPGRPSRDGLSLLSAGISDGPLGKVTVTSIDRKSGEHRFTRELPMGMMVASLVLLDSDRSGIIYLGAMGERGASAAQEGQSLVGLWCLDPLDGRPLGRAELPPNTSADETFRELTVLDEGGVLYLYRTETSSELRRVDCR